MRISPWNAFNLASVGLAAIKPAERPQLFRLSLICPERELARITHFVERDLASASIECLDSRTRLAQATPAVHVDVTVRCPLSRRAGLVRLVECLGLDRDVRSVRWETIPGEPLNVARGALH